jgi:hypothetical protein
MVNISFSILRVINMAMMQDFKVIFNKFNVNRVCTDVKYAQKYIPGEI